MKIELDDDDDAAQRREREKSCFMVFGARLPGIVGFTLEWERRGAKAWPTVRDSIWDRGGNVLTKAKGFIFIL